MKQTRKLVVRAERVVDLRTDELAAVAAGAPATLDVACPVTGPLHHCLSFADCPLISRTIVIRTVTGEVATG